MKKKDKFIVVCALILGVLQVCAVWVSILSVCSRVFKIGLLPFNRGVAQNFYYSDEDDILLIKEYFIQSEFPEIYISDMSGYMFTGIDTKNVQIKNKEVLAAVKRLMFRKGYINMAKEGNTINFTMWRGIADVMKGIAYSIDGENKPTLQFLTKLEPLKEPGWYYYEEDYNEYRTRNN